MENIIHCDYGLQILLPKLSRPIEIFVNTQPLSCAKYKNSIKVLLIGEPYTVIPHLYNSLMTSKCWDLIGLVNPKEYSSPKIFEWWGSFDFWIKSANILPHSFGIKTVLSPKYGSEGYSIRHTIRDIWHKIKMPSTLYLGQKLPKKYEWETIYPSTREECYNTMFHLVVENSSQTNYQTEKLLDCIRSRSVPVYWGHSSVKEHFNEKGIIYVGDKTPNEIVDIINTLTEEDYYSRKEYLEENLVRAETLFLHREDELIKRLLSF